MNINIKKLKSFILRKSGHNNRGVITVRHRSIGCKKIYRKIDFIRNNFNIVGITKMFLYDPFRNVYLALIIYKNGVKKFILRPKGLKIGDKIVSYNREEVNINIGDSIQLKFLTLGTEIHNIQSNIKNKSVFIRAAGCFGQIIGKHDNYVLIKMPSKKIKKFNSNLRTTIGRLSNEDYFLKSWNKAGTSRLKGIRPTVRGSAMNPCDHPHGGGEGKASIGRKYPVTPWGKHALGKKTSFTNNFK